MGRQICGVTFAGNVPAMISQRLNDDLLYDFKEQKRFVREQIELFEPLEASLRKPAATRLVGKGSLIFFELICYLLFIAMVALMIFLTRIYPFTALGDMMYKTEVRNAIGATDLLYFNIAVYILLGTIAVLFLVIARSMAKIRLKNDILHLASRNMKILVGQLLKRRAALDAIEQRHFLELPSVDNVNTIPNPGYDGNRDPIL